MIEVDFKVCRAAGVPLIPYKNKVVKAGIHIESLGGLQEIVRFEGQPI